MTHIGNGVGRIQAIRTDGSLRHIEDDLSSLGYDGIDFEPLGREVRATSYNARGQKVEALGRNEVLAAQSLVRVLRRP